MDNITSKNVTVETLESGIKFFYVKTKYSTCVFSNYGAHILSFITDGNELLWVSKKSHFVVGKAIRGGIPVCWPYFGAAEIAGEPAHGYARLNEWDIQEISDSSNGEVLVKMSLDSSKLPEYCKFLNVVIEFGIGKSLKINLTTTNNAEKDYCLSQALHSYFDVSNIADIRVAGLENSSYFDALTGVMCSQKDLIAVDSEVDRVYLDTDKTCTLIDSNKAYQVQIKKSGSLSTVVWNPWIDKSARMADFGDDEYKNMICIESVNAKTDSRILQKNQSHTLSLEIIKK